MSFFLSDWEQEMKAFPDLLQISHTNHVYQYSSGTVEIYVRNLSNTTIYTQRVSKFPGNGDVVVVSDVRLDRAYRGKGYGRQFRQLRNLCLKGQQYKYVLATVAKDNDIQHHILKVQGAIQLTRLGNSILYGQPL